MAKAPKQKNKTPSLRRPKGRAAKSLSIQDEHKILELAGQGLAMREIAERIRDRDGNPITTMRVSRLLVRLRKERSELTTALATEKLGPHVVNDLDQLELIRADLMARALLVWQDGQGLVDSRLGMLWVRMMDLAAKVIDRKLHYAGVGGGRFDSDADPTPAAARQAMALHFGTPAQREITDGT